MAVAGVLGSIREYIAPALVGAGCAAGVVLGGEFALGLQESRFEERRKVERISFGSLLQARLARELNRELYLTSGLGSYLSVRAGNLEQAEVEAILAKLLADGRYIRNFGVAVGYRLTYVYPVKGNEKAIGLYYPDVPAQWPEVKRVIDGGVPILLGPIDLVQGGHGLIYRVPVRVRGEYWGLLSTVIDVDRLFSEAFDAARSDNVEMALRGKDARGMRGAVIYGDPRLFDQPGVDLLDIDVPGGKWVMALRAKKPVGEQRRFEFATALIWLLAALVGLGAYTLVVQRARLARLALYDALTGVPNRSLIEDRLGHAIAAGRRDPSSISAVVFFDLDGFKSVNDSFGHRAGDAVLQGVAERAVRAVREADSVGRWGGDEFVVLFENVGREQLAELIERVRRAVEMPLQYAGNALTVGVSIGAAIVPDDGESAVNLVRLADSRMYADKVARRGRAAA